MKFAKETEKLLVEYKDVLPEKHLCSDTRYKGKGCFKGECKDATLSETAVLLF